MLGLADTSWATLCGGWHGWGPTWKRCGVGGAQLAPGQKKSGQRASSLHTWANPAGFVIAPFALCPCHARGRMDLAKLRAKLLFKLG